MEPAKQERPEGSKGTLGDVLYADKTVSGESEEIWVALVRCVAAGDQAALHALYERAHRVVFTLTMRISANQATAEELTLDVFHDVWRRAPAYDPANGTVLGWIMNQARSRAIDRLRFEQRKKRVDTGVEGVQPEEIVNGPFESLELQQQGRVVREALQGLTPGEREAIETAYFGGLTHAETAARLNQPLGTIKTRIRTGLTKLRQALAGKL
jgi:RNA polymerase sigma-70 factor (ECF subfamily)